MTIASIKNALSGLKSLVIGLGITGRAFCDENVTVIYPKRRWTTCPPTGATWNWSAKRTPRASPSAWPAACAPRHVLPIASPFCARFRPRMAKPAMAELGPAPQKGSKAPAEFILDFSLCSLCGQCVKACATGGLQFSNDPYMTSVDRNDFKFDLIELLRKEALKRAM